MNSAKYVFVFFIIFIIIYFLIKKARMNYNIDNFYNFDKSYYENVNYQYAPYNYGDTEYTTPLTCEPHFKFMRDPNLPQTKGCYIKLDDMKKYYNPYLKNCLQYGIIILKLMVNNIVEEMVLIYLFRQLCYYYFPLL